MSTSFAIITGMNNEKKNSWLPVWLIAGALAGWAIFLGIGAYLTPADESEGSDPRKLMIVAITTGIFLLLWGIVIWRSSSRNKKGPKGE